MVAKRVDQTEWRRYWSLPERLVMDFVGIATVEVDHQSSVVTFDRLLDPEVEQHLLFDHVLPLVLTRRGHMVVHGGCFSRPEAAAVLLGPSGAGKSTLTAFAWQNGWAVGGDDGAVITPGAPPMIEPTYCMVRLTADAASLLGMDQSNAPTVVGKTRFTGDRERGLVPEPVPLKIIAMLQPSEAGSTAQFNRLNGVRAHAQLFSHTFHSDFGACVPDVFDTLASVVESTLVGELLVPRGRSGLESAEALLRSLVEEVRS